MAAPFKRAHMMMAAINAAAVAAFAIGGGGMGAYQDALERIGPYRSRGKGKGKHFIKTNTGTSRSKYAPHQGKQECARRMRKMAMGVQQ
jgi:hypothetical protein